jgi:hypothetical protein
MKNIYLIVTFVVVALTRVAAQHQAMPAGMSHEEHMRQMQKDEELKKRGAAAMGFDQDATTHHFLLRADGGAIQVESNTPSDSATIAEIRAHLKEIAVAFGKGEFDKPFATHGEVPPGVPVMQANRELIKYRYEDRPGGGTVVLSTNNAEALKAIHDFMRYQITEHKTGDPLTITRN